MEYKRIKDREISSVVEKMILLFLIMALCIVSAHFLMENHEMRKQLREVRTAEENTGALEAENETLREQQEALGYTDERIVREYVAMVLPVIYGDDDTSSYKMIQGIRTYLTDALYEELTGDLMMDAGEDWEEDYSDGITVRTEVTSSYTQRTDEKHIRVFSRCRQAVRTEGQDPTESTLYVGCVFIFEEGVWKLSEITFEENLPGFYEKVY